MGEMAWEERIDFHFEGIESFPLDVEKTGSWLIAVGDIYDREVEELTYVFCDDAYLLEINRTYLQHDELTDIITFQLNPSVVAADIFISVERVKENSMSYECSFEEELRRVMVHGLLHCLGMKDKTEEEGKRMRAAEDKALNLYNEMFQS